MWLLETAEYKAWRTEKSSIFLWCSGIPGAGKTMLSSLIIDVCSDARRNDSRVGAAGVYCSYKNPQSTMNIMGSILQQLLEPLDVAPPSNLLNLKSVESALQDVCSHYFQIFVVVDALDECSDGAGLRKVLQKWRQAVTALDSGTSLHTMITGRTNVHVDVARFLDPELQINILGKDEDVRAFLHQNLSDHDQLFQWTEINPDVEEQIIGAIIARLSGMYVYSLHSMLFVSVICCLARTAFCSAIGPLADKYAPCATQNPRFVC